MPKRHNKTLSFRDLHFNSKRNEVFFKFKKKKQTKTLLLPVIHCKNVIIS